ncbi:MAG: hypothetical protein K2J82_01460 [Muribaculaceae bacterium]|nr:hypothetical protein [Muribaculaceae bacterium]
MNSINDKLQYLQNKILNTGEKIRIMIFGLGSVGLYLLDYIVSTADPRLEIIVVGRNYDKMLSDVNIVRTAATIRRQMRAIIHIEGHCDLEDTDNIASVLKEWNPDFIVNSSRVYSGLKYGSISWSHLRAYGIWTPLSVKYAKNIMKAYEQSDSHAISINTSYSDAVIPWLKSSGMPYFDFGSGNLNHLIPRMKFHIAEKFGIDNYNDIDITLAVSHFHDVVISKEGHSEGQDILLEVKHNGEKLEIDKEELLAACRIAMPVDQKRNMMNASSNYDIINSILTALRDRTKIKIHTPGVDGEIGGYPFIIDGEGEARGYIDESVFSLDQMREANRQSIYLDGVEDVADGALIYTDELIEKVKSEFQTEIPKKVPLKESNLIATQLINNLIFPSVKS